MNYPVYFDRFWNRVTTSNHRYNESLYILRDRNFIKTQNNIDNHLTKVCVNALDKDQALGCTSNLDLFKRLSVLSGHWFSLKDKCYYRIANAIIDSEFRVVAFFGFINSYQSVIFDNEAYPEDQFLKFFAKKIIETDDSINVTVGRSEKLLQPYRMSEESNREVWSTIRDHVHDVIDMYDEILDV